MKRVLIAIILAFSLLLVPSAVSAASGIQVVDKTGDGVWTNNTWEVEIYPGENKTTTISLYNSSSSLLDVEVTIIPDSLDGGNLTFELDRSRFEMPGDSYTDVTLTVEANGSATPGPYTAELTIKSEVPPSPPPIGGGGISKLSLYNLRVENITEDSADILWETSRTSTSTVTYWASLETIVEDESYSKEHIIHLDGLEADTTYCFGVVSRDRYNRRASAEGEFVTLEEEVAPIPPPPTPEPIPPIPPSPPVIVELEPVKPEPVRPEPVRPEPGKEGVYWPWWVVGVGGLAVVGCIGFWLWRRRRKAE